MLNFPKQLFLILCVVLQTLTISAYENDEESDFFNYRFAFVRDLPITFLHSLKQHEPETPIDFDLAKQQHEKYIGVLEGLVPNLIRLKADSRFPDCNFVEDTGIIIGDIAVLSRMGAPERMGEEAAVYEALRWFHMHVIPLEYPCTMDGGDILYTGKHLFVGLSKRTNEEAFKMLQIIFKDRLEVIPVPVSGGLHLKSILSCFDTKTLIVAETRAGLEVKKAIQALTNKDYQFVFVPDPEASNVLRVGNTLIVQEGFPRSESIFFNLCIEKQVRLVKLNMSELIKADGALTCGSILFKP